MALGGALGPPVPGYQLTEGDVLADILGHQFRNRDLLRRALTHRSAASGHLDGFERLEFLGDRVLALGVADLLLARFPREKEGDIAKRFALLVEAKTLAGIARAIGLGAHLVISRGEADAGARDREGILADALEAVIAALYLDGGMPAARAFIERHWLPLAEKAEKPPLPAKTALQEWSQGRGQPLPTYTEVSREGPPHDPRFVVEVALPGIAPAQGSGRSKRLAEQAAAAALLARVTGSG